MEELIKQLQEKHSLTAEQARGILNTITDFIKEKFPMVGGMVDNLFPPNDDDETSAGDTGTTEGPSKKGGSFTDDIL